MWKKKRLRMLSLALAASVCVSSVPAAGVFAMGYRQEDEGEEITDLQVGDWLESDRTYTLGSFYTDTEGNIVEYGDNIVFYTYGNTVTEDGRILEIDLAHKSEGFYTATKNENGQYTVNFPQSVDGNDILINDMTTCPASDISEDEWGIYKANQYTLEAEIMMDGYSAYSSDYIAIKTLSVCTPTQQTPVTYTAEELLDNYFNGNSLNIVLERYKYKTTDKGYVYNLKSIGEFTKLDEDFALFYSEKDDLSAVTRSDCNVWSDYSDLVKLYKVTDYIWYLYNPYYDIQPLNINYCEIDGLKYIINWNADAADFVSHEENGVTYLDSYKGYIYPQDTYIISKDGVEYRTAESYIEEKEDNRNLGMPICPGGYYYNWIGTKDPYRQIEGQSAELQVSAVRYDTKNNKYLDYITYIGCAIKTDGLDGQFITDLKRGDILEGGKTYYIFRTELDSDYEKELEEQGHSGNKNDMQSHFSYGVIATGYYVDGSKDSFAAFGNGKESLNTDILFSERLSGYLFHYNGTFTNKDGTVSNFATVNNSSGNYNDFSDNMDSVMAPVGSITTTLPYEGTLWFDEYFKAQNYVTITTPEGFNWRFDGFKAEDIDYSTQNLIYKFTPLDADGNEVKTASIVDAFTQVQLGVYELSKINWNNEEYLDALFTYDDTAETYSVAELSSLRESCTLYAFPKSVTVAATDYTDSSKKGTVSFSYNDNFDGTDVSTITWSAQTDGEFGSSNYTWQYATLKPDWYWIELYSMKKEYSLSELTMCYKDGVKLIPQNIKCTVLDGNTLEPVDMSVYKETPYWTIKDTDSTAEYCSDITYEIVMLEDFADDYPLIFVYAADKQNVYTEGTSYTASYDNFRYEDSAYKNIHVGKKIRGTDAACTTAGEAVYFAEKVNETWESEELADVIKDSATDMFESVFSAIGYDKDKAVRYIRVDYSEYPKPISETYNMCLSLKEIKSFEDLKDANGDYTSVYAIYYRYPRMAVIPSDSGVTVMFSKQYTTSLPTTTYTQNANSFVETFTTVEEYNNFVKAFMGTQGTKVINSAYDINIAFVNESADIGVNGILTTGTKYTTNLTDKENEIYCYMTARNEGPLEHTIKTPALGHTWSTDESTQIKINIDNPAQDAFIGKVASTNRVPVPSTRDDALALLCTHAENGSTIDVSQLTGNNVLYGTFCTRAQDAFELKIAHEHSYKEPVFDWAKDYSSCTATFECIAGDDTQALSCKVTKTTTPATCTKDGETEYVASVDFGGKTYTDTKTVPLDKLGHSYGEPVFNWSNDDTECEAVFECIHKDDTQSLPCKIAKTETPATCTADGEKRYTATVTFEGKQYQDQKHVKTDMLGHVWKEEWSLFEGEITEELFSGAENEISDFHPDEQELYIRYCTRAHDAYMLKTEKKELPPQELQEPQEPEEPQKPVTPQNPDVPPTEEIQKAPQTGDYNSCWLLVLFLSGSIMLICSKKMKKLTV